MFIRAIRDQDEIQRLYEESQARKGDEIAYELRKEVDLSSVHATRGIEISYNGKFSSNGGILDVDFHWTKSVRTALVKKYVPQYIGSRIDGVRVTEDNIASRLHAETEHAFIPWCNGLDIRGHGRGVLVKFDGFIYHQVGSESKSKLTVIPVG